MFHKWRACLCLVRDGEETYRVLDKVKGLINRSVRGAAIIWSSIDDVALG